MAVNDSHVLLAANDDVTIYPINPVQTINSSDTSFSTTVLGKIYWIKTYELITCLFIHSDGLKLCSALETPLKGWSWQSSNKFSISLAGLFIPKGLWICVLYNQGWLGIYEYGKLYEVFINWEGSCIKHLSNITFYKTSSYSDVLQTLYYAMHRWCNSYSQDPVQRSPILHWVYAGCRGGWICPGAQCSTWTHEGKFYHFTTSTCFTQYSTLHSFL